MKVTSRLIQNEWERRLLAHPTWEVLLAFDPVRGGGPVKPILRRLTHAKKFERKLVQLCREFGFDIESPKYDDFIPNHLTDTGKLEYVVAEHLVNMLKKFRGCRAELERELTRLKNENRGRKRGPFRVPHFVAEHFLVGLHLHRDSTEGLTLLRHFLGPSGGLAVELRENAHSKSMLSLCISRGSENIWQWAAKVRQTFERAALSTQFDREIKSYADCQPELKRLRERVSMLADEILSDVKSGT